MSALQPFAAFLCVSDFAVCETVAVPAIWQSLLFSCESFLDAAGIFEQHLPGRGKP